MSPNKIRVLYLASWYPNRIKPLEGIFIQNHAEAIAKFCNVSVLYITFDPNLKKKADINTEIKNDVFNVRIYLPVPITRKLILTFLHNLFLYIQYIVLGLRIIKEKVGNPDLIQVNVASRIGIVAIIQKIFKGIPYILFEHASVYIKYKRRKEYKKTINIFERVITYLNFSYANGVVSVSDYLNKGIRRTKKIKNNFYVIPNIVKVPGKNEQAIRKDKKVTALTIALLDNRDKNIYELISAFSKVVQKGNINLQLIIIGDGKLKNELEGYAEELGLLNNSIFFLGYIPNLEVYKYLSSANFFILTSKYETFSVVTVEAIANGIPVVVTKCGGPEEIVNKEQGIIINNFDEDSLIRGIEFMAQNWYKYDSNDLRKYVQENYSSTIVGEKLYKLYLNLIRKS